MADTTGDTPFILNLEDKQSIQQAIDAYLLEDVWDNSQPPKKILGRHLQLTRANLKSLLSKKKHILEGTVIRVSKIDPATAPAADPNLMTQDDLLGLLDNFLAGEVPAADPEPEELHVYDLRDIVKQLFLITDPDEIRLIQDQARRELKQHLLELKSFLNRFPLDCFTSIFNSRILEIVFQAPELFYIPAAYNLLVENQNRPDVVMSHILKTTIRALFTAESLKYKESDLVDIAVSGIIKDIGRLTIPSDIMNKDTVFTKEDRKLIETYARNGYLALSRDGRRPNLQAGVAWWHRQDAKPDYKTLPGWEKVDWKRVEKISDLIKAPDIYYSIRKRAPYHDERENLMQVLKEVKAEMLAGRLSQKAFADFVISFGGKK